jgi:nucleotide-binding universal stress UspA family protein
MLRRILVPIDGSKLAEVAIPVALDLARAAKAQVRFVLVHEPEFSALPAYQMAIAPEPDSDERRERDASYLSELTSRIEDTESVPVTARFLDGMAGPTLATEIGSWIPDLVVMASHGRGPFSRFWLGSVADYLIRHVSVPLLLLKPNGGAGGPAPALELDSIVLGWDLSPLGEAILEPVSDLANLFGAKIEVVHVLQDWFGAPFRGEPEYYDPNLLDECKAQAEQSLVGVATRLRQRGVTVEARVETGASVPRTLVDLVNNEPHDLVAITTHGRGGVKRALLGSVADKLIRASNKPVLVLCPRA